MKHFLIPLAALSLLAAPPLLRAQMPGAPGGGAMTDPGMVALFGANTNFTAKMQMRMLDATGAEQLSMDMTMTQAGLNSRTESDMSTMKSAMVSPTVIAQMKTMGMDRSITITDGDKKLMTMIYPGMKAYLSMPMPAAAAQSLTNKPSLKKTELGKETLDNQPCVKNKVSFGDATDLSKVATVWNATDLKDFPVQIQMTQGNQTVVMHYTDIKFGKPDASAFELPKDFTKYDSVMAMMQAMSGRMGAPGAPGMPAMPAPKAPGAPTAPRGQ